eukprot:CAMPEP_0197655548 /NCGR_PEP_ID=MMETSP1338-20131121/39516_1 /TAXON_ID=43686 ORGANISM="Pelagodinium beii, Strain RCC1491" /NCGR_SAMPLE_ID=MMETSP1338 /ASSEMBLY_ACC=CAM_ASM_000754 /LENGTH=119 /DNA_ID=CAMNT_0043231211 /DNA_START=152 /DNA_END=512 /DNA_ORIENTATION=+
MLAAPLGPLDRRSPANLVRSDQLSTISVFGCEHHPPVNASERLSKPKPVVEAKPVAVDCGDSITAFPAPVSEGVEEEWPFFVKALLLTGPPDRMKPQLDSQSDAVFSSVSMSCFQIVFW